MSKRLNVQDCVFIFSPKQVIASFTFNKNINCHVSSKKTLKSLLQNSHLAQISLTFLKSFKSANLQKTTSQKLVTLQKCNYPNHVRVRNSYIIVVLTTDEQLAPPALRISPMFLRSYNWRLYQMSEIKTKTYFKNHYAQFKKNHKLFKNM